MDPSLDSLARLRQLRPLPAELARLGIRTSVVAGELLPSTRFLVGGLLKLGGVERLIASGTQPRRVAEAMAEELRAPRGRRFVLGYVRDTDVAGHAWGWMSEAYLTASRAVDRGLGILNELAEEPGTLVIVTADHGGGGVRPSDHDHPHPINDTIPLLVGDWGSGPGPARRAVPACSMSRPRCCQRSEETRQLNGRAEYSAKHSKRSLHGSKRQHEPESPDPGPSAKPTCSSPGAPAAPSRPAPRRRRRVVPRPFRRLRPEQPLRRFRRSLSASLLSRYANTNKS